MTLPGHDGRSSFRTTRDDMPRLGFRDTIVREYRELQEYMLTPEQLERRRTMSRFRRWTHIPIWLLIVLFKRLTVARRILIAGALILAVSVHTGDSSGTEGRYVAALVVVMFVLLLELKDKLIAQEELDDGRVVQEALLPPREPVVPGWQLWLFTRSANEVGGDLLDFIPLEGDRFAVAIGDVSGKGLKAALVTARLQSTLRAFIEERDSPAALGQRLNRIFRRDGLPGSFASLTIFEFSPTSETVRSVNAGHLPAYIIRAGGIEAREKGGPAIGLTADARYADETITVGPEDVLFAYSDGVTEARNEAGEFYGDARLRNILLQMRGLPPRVMGERLIDEVDRFAGEARQHDDLTLLILRRSG